MSNDRGYQILDLPCSDCWQNDSNTAAKITGVQFWRWERHSLADSVRKEKVIADVDKSWVSDLFHQIIQCNNKQFCFFVKRDAAH